MGRGFSAWTLSAQGVCFGCGLYLVVVRVLDSEFVLRVGFLSIINRVLCVPFVVSFAGSSIFLCQAIAIKL